MKKYILFLVALIFIGGCSQPKYLSTPKEFKYSVKGLYAELNVGPIIQVFGEIIEITSDSIKILPRYLETPEIITLPKHEIESIDIIIASTSNNPTGIKTWAALINLISVGHGLLAVFSLPINAIAAIAISNGAAKSAYRVNYPNNVSWDEMSKFARFPQGIPRNINLEDLQ